MRYFITGKNGFIAKHLLGKLQNEIVETTSRQDNTIEKLNIFKPDIIFHLCAEIQNVDNMFETNVKLTHDILEYCRHHSIVKLIVIGSSSEYGRKQNPISETDFLDPMTIYEGTKSAASMLVQSYSFTYNIPTTLIRPFTIYGENEKSNKLTQILFNKYNKNEVLYLTSGVHDYMYIEDFINALLKITFYKEEKIFNIVNVGSGIQTTNEDFVRCVQNVLNYNFIIQLTNNKKVYDSENWICNSHLLNSKYNFSCSYNLISGLKETYHKLLNGENN